jgi:hypothetical protein
MYHLKLNAAVCNATLGIKLPNLFAIQARPRKRLNPYSQLLVNMLFKCLAVFAAAISVTLAQTIELGFPQNGDNFTPGQEVVAQVILPVGSWFVSRYHASL